VANSLIVEAGSVVTLEENMPNDFAAQPERLQINKLEDFVDHGLVKSTDTLNRLLDAAKIVTEEKLRDPSTHSPFVPIRGTSRADLRRFGAFTSQVQDVSTVEANAFWRVARTIDPNMLTIIDTSATIGDSVTVGSRLWDFVRFVFENVTVEEGAILRVSNQVNYITCGDLLIKRSGQIVANGGASLFISANSIQGEQ
jgi:hypothetical protein